MPGFHKNRFINLSLSEEEEFTCDLCEQLLCDPVVVPCCGQTYCNDCIQKWLMSYNICPLDKRPLKVEELQRTQKIVSNLINKLIIRCDFYKNGCKTICQLGMLSSHTQNCGHNPKRRCDCCDNLLITNDSHNCIDNLKVTNRCLKLNVKTLESQNEKLHEENQKLVHTFQTLQKGSQNDCMDRAMNSARKNLSNPKVSNIDPIYINESELIRIAQNAIIQCNCYKDIALQMSKEVNIDDYANYRWNTFAFSNNCCANAFSNDDCIEMSFGDLTIQLTKYVTKY